MDGNKRTAEKVTTANFPTASAPTPVHIILGFRSRVLVSSSRRTFRTIVAAKTLTDTRTKEIAELGRSEIAVSAVVLVRELCTKNRPVEVAYSILWNLRSSLKSKSSCVDHLLTSAVTRNLVNYGTEFIPCTSRRIIAMRTTVYRTNAVILLCFKILLCVLYPRRK